MRLFVKNTKQINQQVVVQKKKINQQVVPRKNREEPLKFGGENILFIREPGLHRVTKIFSISSQIVSHMSLTIALKIAGCVNEMWLCNLLYLSLQIM